MSSEAYQQLIELYAEQVMERGKRSEVERMEMAKAIGLMDPNSPVVSKLDELIMDKSAEVSRYAIQSAARHKKEEHIPAIIHKLINPFIHDDAVSALKNYGQSAQNILLKYLADSSIAIEIRKNVVKVLAQIGTQEAVQPLLDELENETEELDADIFDALDRIRAENAEINFPPQLVQRRLWSAIKKYCQAFLDLMNLESDEQNTERVQQLKKRLAGDFSNIFKLLGLYYPHEDIVKAYQNLQTGTKDLIAYAIELLDNTLTKEMKDSVLPLVEDMSTTERQQAFQKILKNLS
jgi:AAA family ATP:ADP antiporter